MTMTSTLVRELKENDQDFEWYPTTNRMILAILRRIPTDAESILDIGAGDGRVLKKFAERCENAPLYSIEISPILVQAQPEDIIPIGTNLYEQNLSALPVGIIFSNPMYSEYEEWTCKIIEEGYAKKAFLIIPQRWKDSKLIKRALEMRGADARVIHSDNFLDAERKARAIVDIVEISFPTNGRYGRSTKDSVKDPFDIWFDENIDTFDQAEEFKESETSEELARRYKDSNIGEMVEAYLAEYKLLEENYRAIFKLDYEILRELGINKDNVRGGLKKKMAGLKMKYWDILFKKLDAITSRLTTRSKKSLMDKLTAQNIIEFTAANAYVVVLWAIKNANKYFEDQAVQLFYDLSTFEGAMKYKSNQRTWLKNDWRYNIRNDRPDKATHYMLDYRIITSVYKAMWDGGQYGFGKYDYPGDLNKNAHNLISDIVAVMNNLGFVTNSVSSYNRQWIGGKWQDWYDTDMDNILFQVKAYKNGNVHIRFMPVAIRALNIEVGRILKWVQTKSEVVTEMGYSVSDANKYFNKIANNQIAISNLKRLTG